jgi:hypothetical protein
MVGQLKVLPMARACGVHLWARNSLPLLDLPMNLSNPKNSPDSINLSGYLRAIPSVDAPKSARSSGAYLGLQVVESSTTFVAINFLRATKETVGDQSASSNS